jgi:hypothetical protein
VIISANVKTIAKKPIRIFINILSIKNIVLKLYDYHDIIMKKIFLYIGVGMKKQFIANAITYLICMIAASLLNLAVSALAVKIVNALVLPEFFVLAIVRAVSGILTGCIIIGAIFLYEGYKSVSFSFWKVVLPMLAAAVVHFIIAFVFKFYPFVAGGTHYLGGLIESGDGFSSFDSVADVRLGAYIAAFWIAKSAEIIVAPICCLLGKRLRIKNRETIKGYNNYNNMEEK